jgi:hypothetical protein
LPVSGAERDYFRKQAELSAALNVSLMGRAAPDYALSFTWRLAFNDSDDEP